MLAGSPSAQSTPGRRSGRGIPRTAPLARLPTRPRAFQPQVDPFLDRPFHQAAARSPGRVEGGRQYPGPIPMAREVVQHAPAAAARRSAASGSSKGRAQHLAHAAVAVAHQTPPAVFPTAMPSTPPLPPTPAGRRPPGVPTRETRPAIARRRRTTPPPSSRSTPPRRPARSAATPHPQPTRTPRGRRPPKRPAIPRWRPPPTAPSGRAVPRCS